MTDAELIHAALLRAEKRLEAAYNPPAGAKSDFTNSLAGLSLLAIATLRQEVGDGLRAREKAGQ